MKTENAHKTELKASYAWPTTWEALKIILLNEETLPSRPQEAAI